MWPRKVSEDGSKRLIPHKDVLFGLNNVSLNADNQSRKLNFLGP